MKAGEGREVLLDSAKEKKDSAEQSQWHFPLLENPIWDCERRRVILFAGSCREEMPWVPGLHLSNTEGEI